ncbi:MAG: hypothetical protein ABJC09_13260 [Terriglobia bacterium]
MRISERTVAIVTGTSLVIHGALKRSPLGAAIAGIGAAIVYLGFRRATDMTLTENQLLRSSYTMPVEPYDAFVKWQDLSELPSVIEGIGAVKKLSNGNWKYSVPGAGSLEVEIARQQPGHVIEWRSVPGSKINAVGTVRFTRKRNGRGTKVHMEISHRPAA